MPNAQNLSKTIAGRWVDKQETAYLFTETEDDWQPLELMPKNQRAIAHYYIITESNDQSYLNIKDGNDKITKYKVISASLSHIELKNDNSTIKLTKK